MSVRIYQLSKQLQMENKELIALLQSRGLKVESASNTIPNIYADDLLKEFAHRQTEDLVGRVQDETPAHLPEVTAPTPEQPLVGDQDPVHQKADQPIEARQSSSLPQSAAAPVPPPVLKKAPTLPRLPEKNPVIANQIANQLPEAPVFTVTPPKTNLEPMLDTAQKTTTPPLPPRATAPKAPALPPRIPRATPHESPVAVSKRKIACKPPIVVRDFALLLDLKPFRLISELMEMGIFASMNQTIDEPIAIQIAERYGIELEVRHRGESQPQQAAPKKIPVAAPVVLESRPPVVCVLGHVDHGKTSLLDAIRRTHVVKGEAGGITQHIGAYQVEHKHHHITFIDTPGHAAFSKMRERGANVTDIAVLVVAADDGFMPQTDEALKFAQKANVPVVVAINKMDAKGANPEKVKQQLQQRGIASEDWGGETLVALISAIKSEGIAELLDSILLQAEMLELKADRKANPQATIIEAQMEQGLGSTASVIVNEGTLKPGDFLVCGQAYCRIRSMVDDKGKPIKEALPSTPVKLIGWSMAPEAGLIAHGVKNEKEAKIAIQAYLEDKKQAASLAVSHKAPMDIHALFATLNDQKKLLKVIIKGDVQGSIEALAACLLDIKSEKVSLEVLDASVGLISKNDVTFASTSQAHIVAFNTRFDTGVQALAKHHGVPIIQHNIIYELINQVRDAMAELLDPELKEVKVGLAEVRQVFGLSKGAVAGCMVTEGRIHKDMQARVLRKGKLIHEAAIDTLKRFKDDTNEVRAGYECGIRLDGFDAYEAKDVIECFQIEKTRAAL